MRIYPPYMRDLTTYESGPKPLFWSRLHTPVLAPGRTKHMKVRSMYRVSGYNPHAGAIRKGPPGL